MDCSGLTVIIPTLNEERNIGRLLGALRRLYPGARFIVADDGSRDQTVEISRREGAEVLDRGGEETKGITASVLHALGKVETDFFVVMDADLQHPPEKVGELLAALQGGADLAIAWRSDVPGWAFHRKLVSKGAELLGKARLAIGGNPVPRDILSGFFGGRAEVVHECAGKGPGRFVGKGYKVLFDFLKGARKEKLRISEIPYVFGMREGGSSKISGRHMLYFLQSVFS